MWLCVGLLPRSLGVSKSPIKPSTHYLIAVLTRPGCALSPTPRPVRCWRSWPSCESRRLIVNTYSTRHSQPSTLTVLPPLRLALLKMSHRASLPTPSTPAHNTASLLPNLHPKWHPNRTHPPRTTLSRAPTRSPACTALLLLTRLRSFSHSRLTLRCPAPPPTPLHPASAGTSSSSSSARTTASAASAPMSIT